MEKDLFQKIIGIIIIIALAGSMLAAALIYLPDNSNQQNVDPDLIPQNQPVFNYTTSFETQIIQDLEAIKIIVETSEMNKSEIDYSIQKIEGISRIESSQFISTGSEKWYYLAEINLRKNTNIKQIVEEIFSQQYFNGEKQAMKRVSISTPKEDINLVDSETNFSRKFQFDYATTFAIVSLDSLPNDNIIVEGTIRLQGNTITYIELMETENKTSAPTFFEVEKELLINDIGNELFFEVTTDKNIDQNYYQEQLKQLDENAIFFVYESKIYGQTIAKKELVEEILVDINNIQFKQAGTIFIDSLFVEDLNKEIVFEKETQIEFNYGKKVGDKILAVITLAISRTSEEIMQVIEKQ